MDLMTGPKGNSEFCFSETLNVPRGEAGGNIEVEADSKIEKKLRINDLLRRLRATKTVLAIRAAVKPSCPTETTQ